MGVILPQLLYLHTMGMSYYGRDSTTLIIFTHNGHVLLWA